MIPDAIHIPSEQPYSVLDVKRSLLSFNQVRLPHPEDRDLIPANAFLAAQGMPMLGMNVGAVRPLGKTPDWDEQFERMLDESAPALETRNLIVLDRPTDPPSGLTVGAVPLPNGTPDPAQVYALYRQLAEHPAWVARASRGIDVDQVREHAAEMVLASADDGKMSLYVDGEPAFESGQLAGTAEEAIDPEDVALAARVAHARIGSVVKFMARASASGVTPIASLPGSADALLDLGPQLATVADEGDDAELGRLLARVHRVTVQEHVDDDLLAQMSVQEVLQARTTAWGRFREGRLSLHRAVRQLAVECETDEEFDRRVDEELRNYRELAGEYGSTNRRLIETSIIRGGIAGLPAAMAVHASAGMDVLSVLSLIAAGAAPAAAAMWDVLRRGDQFRSSFAYAVANPYQHVLRGRDSQR